MYILSFTKNKTIALEPLIVPLHFTWHFLLLDEGIQWELGEGDCLPLEGIWQPAAKVHTAKVCGGPTKF